MGSRGIIWGYITFAKQIFHSVSYFISAGDFTRRRRISLKKALDEASAFFMAPQTGLDSRPAGLGRSRSQQSTGLLLCTARPSRPEKYRNTKNSRHNKVSAVHGTSNRTRTCDTIGQKHSRLTSLGALVILLVFSCSSRPCICHRQRGAMNQLTAATSLWKHSIIDLIHAERIKRKKTTR